MRVWLLDPAGEPVQACETPLRGRRLICFFTPGEIGLAIGAYRVAVGEVGDVVPGVALEVVPDGTLLVTIDAVYQGTMWPLLQWLTVRSHVPEPVSLSGWALVDVVTGHQFVFPGGTELHQGRSVQLDFSGPGGGTCPPSTSLYFHWCSVVSDYGRIDYSDEGAFWGGGAVELWDAGENVIAVWIRP
ncbi:MAG: hypothetical protein ACE5E8_01080 [Acidimicrobiia bacterium]